MLTYRLPEAGHFLTARAKHLESLPPSTEVHHALSTTYHHLKYYDTALSHARLALEGDSSNKEMAWHLELLKRQNDIIEKRDAHLAALGSTRHLKMPHSRQVTPSISIALYT